MVKLNIILVQRIILIVCLSVAPSFALCKQITIKSVEKEIRLKNFSKAEDYLKKLSRVGNTKAQYMLAVLYRNGHVIQKNEKKAYSLFLEAARKKHIKSQYELAVEVKEPREARQTLVEAVLKLSIQETVQIPTIQPLWR